MKDEQRKCDDLMQQIKELRKDESEINSEISKIEEKLEEVKKHKSFIHLLALICGKKTVFMRKPDDKPQTKQNGFFITEEPQNNKRKQS